MPNHAAGVLRAHIDRLTAERDQYKLAAELNAQTAIRKTNELRKARGIGPDDPTNEQRN